MTSQTYTLDELAARCGLAPYILQYWLTKFPELSGPDQGKTIFTAQDEIIVRRVKQLLYVERVTIEQAQARLAEPGNFVLEPQPQSGHGALGSAIKTAADKAAAASAGLLTELSPENDEPSTGAVGPRPEDRPAAEVSGAGRWRSQLEARDSQIEELRRRVDQLTAERDGLSAELRTARDESAAERDRLTGERDSLAARLSAETAESGRLREQTRELRERASEAALELTRIVSDGS